MLNFAQDYVACLSDFMIFFIFVDFGTISVFKIVNFYTESLISVSTVKLNRTKKKYDF